jgi:RHS repeat-associated protein
MMPRWLLTLFAAAACPTLAAAQSSGEVVEYYHLDALGSVRVVTGADGTVIRRHDFKPFGEEINVTFPNPDRKLFTGQERDSETALDYFGARFYQAKTGRFSSPDPVTANTLRLVAPLRWNAYAYAKSNPLIYVDSDGRDAAYINFSQMATGFGHAGILAVHADGTATYSRSGPAKPGWPTWTNQVRTTTVLPTVQFGADGLPTTESYIQIADALALFEGADPSTIGIAYFQTGPAETAAIELYMWQNQAASDKGQLSRYWVYSNSCRDYALRGLVAGRALGRADLVVYPAAPNDVWKWIIFRADDNQTNLVPKGKITTRETYCLAGSPGCAQKH